MRHYYSNNIPTVIQEFPTSISDAELEAMSKEGKYSEVAKVYAGIKIYLDFYKKICSAKAILDSPQTHLLKSREDSFSAQFFLVQVRAAVGEFVTLLCKSPDLMKLPSSIIDSFLELLTIILKGESEPVILAPNFSEGFSEHEKEQSMPQLLEMGFSQAEATEAMGWVGGKSHGLIYAIEQLVAIRNDYEHLEKVTEASPATDQSISLEELSVRDPQKDPESSSRYNVKASFPEALLSLFFNRKRIKESCFTFGMELLTQYPSLSHSISELLYNTVQINTLSEKCGAQALLRFILYRLQSFNSERNTDPVKMKSVLHVLGLLLNHHSFIRYCRPELEKVDSLILELLAWGIGQKTIWIAHVLLVIEGIFADMDHIIPVPFSKLGKGETQVRYRKLLSVDSIDAIYDHLLDLLQQDNNFETSIGLLRLLMRYTKSDTKHIAKFISSNGINSILKLASNLSQEQLLSAQGPIVIIFRHVLERENNLKGIFTSEVQKSFALQGRNSNFADVNAFINNNRFLVLRDAETFVNVASEVCYIPRYIPEGRGYSMPIAQQVTERIVATTQDHNHQSVAGKSSLLDNPQTPARTSSLDLLSSSGVVLTLLAILYSKKDQKFLKNIEAQVLPVFMQRIFLLQCLTELTSCFNDAKLEFINFSRRGSKEVAMSTPSKPRATMLNIFLHDFIPLTFMDDLETDEKKLRYYISNWSMATLVSLCTPTGESQNGADSELLISVRKFVLEGVARCFRDACQSSETALMRYSRLACLGDLVFRLLTARANVSSDTNTTAGRTNSEEYQKQMARLMIEKSFVSLLIGGLADLDFTYPHSRKLVRVLLKPLKFLSRMAVTLKLEPNGNGIDQNGAINTEEITAAFSSQSQSEEEDNEMAAGRHTPDLFRNSSLGMFHGGIEEEADDYESNDDDDDIFDDDEEYDEDDGSVGGSVIMDEDEEMNSDHRHSDMDVSFPGFMSNTNI